MTLYDTSSFAAGRTTGTRVAACVARLAALELTDRSRWWNRRRHRHMARALVACAEELEGAADADDGDCGGVDGQHRAFPRLVARPPGDDRP